MTRDPGVLAAAFEETRSMTARPWKDASSDPMRDRLDRAAAATTGIPLDTIRDWRAMVSREPTVSNQHAQEAGC